MTRRSSSPFLVLGLCALGMLFGIGGWIAGSDQTVPPRSALPARPEPGQTEPADKELAKVRSELAANRKALNETKEALAKCQMDQVAAKAKLAEMTRAGESLRKELESEKAKVKGVVAKLDAATKEVARVQEERTTAQKTLASKQAELATVQKTLAEITSNSR
jgi:chromosome segregation ATPase